MRSTSRGAFGRLWQPAEPAGVGIVYSRSGGVPLLITFKVEIECEDDGRWIAGVNELPGHRTLSRTGWANSCSRSTLAEAGFKRSDARS